MKNRSDSGKKRLALVVVLLFIPICILGYLFVKQSQKDISFAEKEVAGVRYLAAIFPVIHQLGEGTIPADIRELEAAARRFDRAMASSRQSEAAIAALKAPQVSPAKVIPVLRELVIRVGDQSNLILDPDLDTYYLMDLVLMRLPDLTGLVSDARHGIVATRKGGQLAPGTEARLQLLAGQLEAVRTGTARSFASAFDGNRDGQLRRALGSTAIDLGSQVQGLVVALQSHLKAPSGGQIVGGGFSEPIEIQQQRLSGEILVAWKRSASELDRLLKARVARLSSTLWLTLAASAMVALVALALATGIFRTMLSRLDERILHLAHHDVLTGLLNRAAFALQAEDALQRALPGEITAVMFLDLDRFKQLNDTHGHKAGDDVIVAMAQRITEILGPNNPVCRLGGDEFTFICRGLASLQDAEVIARGVLAAMRKPFVFGEQRFCTSASIGVALAPEHGDSLENLMIDADLALYAAKGAGRDCMRVFDAGMMDHSRQQSELEQHIRRALAEDRFSLDFQPQFDLQGQRLAGFEALIRLRSETGQPLDPAKIIAVAEQTKLIASIGNWVIHRACAAATNWPEHLFVAVNISPVELAESDVAATIAKALRLSGLSPHRLEVEVTEGVLLEPKPAVLKQLHRIRAMGVAVAIDDFGTGHSGLSYMWQFPFNKLKIDRSLTSGAADTNAAISKVFRGVVAMGRELGVKVTAEGVETELQYAALATMGCEVLQGYLLGRPMPEIDLAAFTLHHMRRQFHSTSPTPAMPEIEDVASGTVNIRAAAGPS